MQENGNNKKILAEIMKLEKELELNADDPEEVALLQKEIEFLKFKLEGS